MDVGYPLSLGLERASPWLGFFLVFHFPCPSPGSTSPLMFIPLPFNLLLSAPLPSAPLLWCLTFVPSAPLHRSHPFRSMLSIWAIFSGRDPLSAGALSLLFFFVLFPPAPFVPSSPFPRSSLLSPISCPAPVSSLPTSAQPESPGAHSFLSCCISLSYFPFSDIVPLPTSPPCGAQRCCCCTAALSHSHPAVFQGPPAAPRVPVPFLPLSLSPSLPFPLCSPLFPPSASSPPEGRWFHTNAELQGSSGPQSTPHHADFISTCCFRAFYAHSEIDSDGCSPPPFVYHGPDLKPLALHRGLFWVPSWCSGWS